MNKVKTDAYPTLKKMGLESPKQIDKFYITSLNRVDVLRIVYDRPDGSFLPSTRSYKFPRVSNSATAEGEGKPKAAAQRTHPMLREALDELKSIIEAKSTKENIVAEILSEIELLEEDIAIRSECLKVLVAKIPKID